MITSGLRARLEGREERVGNGTWSGSRAARGLRGVMRLGSKSEVAESGEATSDAASPSGWPDMGGSGSPTPSTTRPGGAGRGVRDVGIARPGAAETAPTLADLDRSGIGKSDFAEALVGPDTDGFEPPLSRLAAVGLSPTVPFGKLEFIDPLFVEPAPD